MNALLMEKIKNEKLIAIVRGVEPEQCLKVADALYEGGFRLMEITFNQAEPNSWENTAGAIRAVGEKYVGRMEVGAGTVISLAQLKLAHAAGAKFIVSPDADPDIIKSTKELGMVSVPGAFTPTEIKAAYAAGADIIKLFPVAQLGPAYVKAICAPLNHIPMMAVGGINADNLKSYLEQGLCGAGIGGNLVNKNWIRDGEFHKITELAANLVSIAKS